MILSTSTVSHSEDSQTRQDRRYWAMVLGDGGHGTTGMCGIEHRGARELAAIAADRNRPRKHIERARIVLASADRHSAQRVAQSIGVSRPTVWRWQQRFAESGGGGLLRDKTGKPGKAPFAAGTIAQVVALTCPL